MTLEHTIAHVQRQRGGVSLVVLVRRQGAGGLQGAAGRGVNVCQMVQRAGWQSALLQARPSRASPLRQGEQGLARPKCTAPPRAIACGEEEVLFDTLNQERNCRRGRKRGRKSQGTPTGKSVDYSELLLSLSTGCYPSLHCCWTGGDGPGAPPSYFNSRKTFQLPMQLTVAWLSPNTQ
ncbi:hypothetical protein AOLI_G00296120 [Acnodon oligacanthus]